MQKKNFKKQKNNQKFQGNSWPLVLDSTLLLSLKRNVTAREVEYLEEVKFFKSKLAENYSSKGLNYLLFQWNEKYPAESFILKLYNNPHSILFLYNIIPSLLPRLNDNLTNCRENVEILLFVFQNLCRSLIKHNQILLAIDDKLECSLVNLSISLTQYIQVILSDHEDLINLMSTCTCLLLILSNNSMKYVRNIISLIDNVSNILFKEYVGTFNLDINDSFKRTLFDNNISLPYPFNNRFDLGNFVSNIRYLSCISNIYMLNNERSTILTPSKKVVVEDVILSTITKVLNLMENMIKFYCGRYVQKNYFDDYSKILSENEFHFIFSDFITPMIIDLYLKWIIISQEISFKRLKFSGDYFISNSPKAVELMILPIQRDRISDEITQIILNFFGSYSNQLSIANKYSIPIISISRNMLLSSLLISNSLNSSSIFALNEPYFYKEANFSHKDVNWLRILSNYFQVFSNLIAPLLVIFEIINLPLDCNIHNVELDAYLLPLYEEWINICHSGILELIFETLEKASKITENNRTSFSTPMLILKNILDKEDQNIRGFNEISMGISEQTLSNNVLSDMQVNLQSTISNGIFSCSNPFDNIINYYLKNRNLFNKNSTRNDSINYNFSILDQQLIGIDNNSLNLHYFKALVQKFEKISFNKSNIFESNVLDSDYLHFLQKYRNDIYHLLSCLTYMILAGSKECILLSINAWESISFSLRLSSSCLPQLQSLFDKLCDKKYEPLNNFIKKIGYNSRLSYVLPDIGEIGLVNIIRYFVWSVVNLGEYPQELYNMDNRSDYTSLLLIKKRSDHLKTRETIRDSLRNTIFFPDYSASKDVIVKDEEIKHLVPLYTFQLFLKDVFMHLNGYHLIYHHRNNSIKMRKTNLYDDKRNVNFIVTFEALLHAFSAILKRGFTSFSIKPLLKTDKEVLYESQDDINKSIKLICDALSLDDEESLNNNTFNFQIKNLEDYFEFTRLLFDATILKIFDIIEELDDFMDIYLSKTDLSDKNSEIYERLFRQLLCTFVTLIGVNSTWFNNKSKLIYLKGFKYIFKSLLLKQDDQFFPLAIEQDHVGALALLKLSQHKIFFDSEILNYTITKCLDLFSKLFSMEKFMVNMPTMTLESYLILLTSLGVSTSHFLEFNKYFDNFNNKINDNNNSNNIRNDNHINVNDYYKKLNSRLSEWKNYVGLILDKYLVLFDNILEILNFKVKNRNSKDKELIDVQVHQTYNILLVLYLLFCGLEVFISSIFPSKQRPFSYILLTIGADKFDHMNILEYCKRLFTETQIEDLQDIYKEASNYITKIFITKFYSKIRLIIRFSSIISPNWLIVLFNPYTSLISCILQLPQINLNINDDVLLLGLFRFIGYNEYLFLSREKSSDKMKFNCNCNSSTTFSIFQAFPNNTNSNGVIIKKGLHPSISLIYKCLLDLKSEMNYIKNPDKEIYLDRNFISKLLSYNQNRLNSYNSKSGISNIDIFNLLKNELLLYYDNDTSNDSKLLTCICNIIPNITLPLSVMMIKMPFISLKYKSKYLDPILSFMNSFKLFTIHPIMKYLSYYSIDASMLINRNFNIYNDGFNYEVRNINNKGILTSFIGENYIQSEEQNINNYIQYFKMNSGLNSINKLNSFCLYMNHNNDKDYKQNDHCCCLEYHDGVCLTLLLFLKNLTNLGYRDNNTINNILQVFDSIIKLYPDLFIEYVVSRCIITLLIGIGMQHSNAKNYQERKLVSDCNEFDIKNSIKNQKQDMTRFDNLFTNLNYNHLQINQKSNNTPSIVTLSTEPTHFDSNNKNTSVENLVLINNLLDIDNINDNSVSGISSVNDSNDYNHISCNINDYNSINNHNNRDNICSSSNLNSDNHLIDINEFNDHLIEKNEIHQKNIHKSQNNANNLKDQFYINDDEHFVPLKLINNQRWVIITIKYLFGDFIKKGNKQILEKLFTNSFWGVELIVTIFILILDSYTDSELISILSDILILIRQLLDRKRFRNLLEATFCRLPIRLLIQSSYIASEYPSLHFPLIGKKDVFVNSMNIKDGNFANNHHYPNLQKFFDSPIADSIRKIVENLLESNFFEYNNQNTLLDIFSHNGKVNRLPFVIKSISTSDVIKDFIQQITMVPVSQSNKTRFRQIMKEFCIKPINK